MHPRALQGAARRRRARHGRRPRVHDEFLLGAAQARRARRPVERKTYAGEDPEASKRIGSSVRDVAKARSFIRAAKMTAAKGVACWCPNPACDEVIDLLSAMPICKVCACEVCKSCYQKKHAGPCAVAADSSSLKLCRDNFQKCPRCKAVVEKKMACDHASCRCGPDVRWLVARAATAVPWSASGRASSTREAQRPVNDEPEPDSDSDDGDYRRRAADAYAVAAPQRRPLQVYVEERQDA